MMAETAIKKSTAFLSVTFLLFSFVCSTHANEGCTFSREVSSTPHNISSPNYPLPYRSSRNCAWSLTASPGERIVITFLDFETEKGSSSCLDFVSIYDGNTVHDNHLGEFCGSEIPPPITSTTNKMLVVFITDGSVVHKGFIASYASESGAGQFIGISHFAGARSTERTLTQFLLKTRQDNTRSINKWGSSITRTAVALFLQDQRTFETGTQTGGEITLELSLQLLSKLALKKKISTKDLALYINALTVTCFDPKDFFGVNLVEELRKRVNKSNKIHPFSMLTLCNAGDNMTMDDVQKLQEQYVAHVRPVWTDIQAMVIMALSCIHNRSELDLKKTFINDMVSELKKKQNVNGSIDDWKITTLVIQALIAAGDYKTDFDLRAAVKVVVDGIGNHTNVPDVYYALPIFKEMSLANISSNHCEGFVQTETKDHSDDHTVEHIQLQISVITGDDMDFSRTWKLKIPSNYSFYQALEKLGTLEPTYKVQYRISEGKPYVVGLGNFLDDPEVGNFWFVYSKPLSSAGSLYLIDLSPVDIPINKSHEMILWYRSGIVANSEEESEE